jgi:hypothetical protein
MKLALLLILASCVPQVDKASITAQVQRGLQWLRIGQAFTNGCLNGFKSPTKEQTKKCNVAGTNYANSVYPLGRE